MALSSDRAIPRTEGRARVRITIGEDAGLCGGKIKETGFVDVFQKNRTALSRFLGLSRELDQFSRCEFPNRVVKAGGHSFRRSVKGRPKFIDDLLPPLPCLDPPPDGRSRRVEAEVILARHVEQHRLALQMGYKDVRRNTNSHDDGAIAVRERGDPVGDDRTSDSPAKFIRLPREGGDPAGDPGAPDKLRGSRSLRTSTFPSSRSEMNGASRGERGERGEGRW